MKQLLDMKKSLIRGKSLRLAGTALTPLPALPNQSLWLAADKIVGLADGDHVATWADASGNSRDATNGTPANAPIYKANIQNHLPVVRFDGVTGHNLATASFFGAGWNKAFTYYLVAFCAAPASMMLNSCINGSAWYHAREANNTGRIHVGNLSTISEDFHNVPYGSFYPNTWTRNVIESVSYDGNTLYYRESGVQKSRTDTHNLGLSGAFYLGSYSDNSLVWTGDIGEVIIYNAAHTPTQMASVEAYLSSKWNIPLRSKHWMFLGDSRTAGAYSATEQAYPGALLSLYGNPRAIQPFNAGLSGQTVADMVTNEGVTIRTYMSGATQNLAIVWGGVNDFSGGADAATIYGRLQTLCTYIKAAGFKTIVCTEIDAQGVGATWHSTVYPALNVLLRADHSWADGLADLGGDARLQDATNGTYFYSDKLHMVDGGFAVIASIVKAAIDALP